MAVKKPFFEKISPTFGSSILVKQYADPCRNKLPFWHFHPEIELIYVNGGSGKRHIGHHLSYFNNGDLMLIGSNLPHYGFTDRLTGNKSETIIQMKEDFLGEEFLQTPEMSHINKLFEKARKGITFYGNTKRRIGSRIEKLPALNNFERLINLLVILNDLSQSEEYKILNIDGLALEIEPQDNDRINEIYQFVRENFQYQITLDEIADIVSMTVPAFCRFFKKKSGKTFTKFVNEYRLVHASKLLAEKPTSITEICYESGFNNFSHFNKLFKQFTGKSPSDYRNSLKQIVQ